MINISRTFERSSTCKLSKTSVSQVVHFVDLLYDCCYILSLWFVLFSLLYTFTVRLSYM